MLIGHLCGCAEALIEHLKKQEETRDRTFAPAELLTWIQGPGRLREVPFQGKVKISWKSIAQAKVTVRS